MKANKIYIKKLKKEKKKVVRKRARQKYLPKGEPKFIVWSDFFIVLQRDEI